MASFGKRLRIARLAHGFSQGILADLAKTSQAKIWSYEHGTSEPSLATFCRLCAVLNGGGVRWADWLVGAPTPIDPLSDWIGVLRSQRKAMAHWGRSHEAVLQIELEIQRLTEAQEAMESIAA